MALPTNTHTTFANIGVREDLSELIALVTPEETPFLSNIGRSTAATNTFHEWQTQSLTAAAFNAVLEGDDATTDAANTTTRVGNYTMISDKVARVTGSAEAETQAGRASEMAFQETSKAIELRRDQEFALLSNNPSVAGNTTTARELGGFQTWVTTNATVGATGSTGGFSAGLTTARTTGTNVTVTEALVQGVMQSAFNSGGMGISQLYMPADIKQTFSGFSGIAGIRSEVQGNNMAVIHGAADVYVSDFGVLNLIPDAFMQSGNNADECIFFINPNMISYVPLQGRDTFSQDLSKTGDSDRKQILAEYTLQVDNEAAHGILADVNA